MRVTYPNGVQREYTVKGIFRAREMQRADRQTFVTRKEMASVLGRETYSDRASEILIKSKKGIDESRLIQKLMALNIDAEIRGWKEYGL